MESNIRAVYAEVDYILSKMPKLYIEKVPIKLREKFRNRKDYNYEVFINKNKHLKEQNLKKETLLIISILKYNYWCKDEEEKKKIEKIFNDNEIRYHEKLKEDYNYEDIFKRKYEQANINEPEENEKSLIKYKSTWYMKLLDFIRKKSVEIKSIFRRSE